MPLHLKPWSEFSLEWIISQQFMWWSDAPDITIRPRGTSLSRSRPSFTSFQVLMKTSGGPFTAHKSTATCLIKIVSSMRVINLPQITGGPLRFFFFSFFSFYGTLLGLCRSRFHHVCYIFIFKVRQSQIWLVNRESPQTAAPTRRKTAPKITGPSFQLRGWFNSSKKR